MYLPPIKAAASHQCQGVFCIAPRTTAPIPINDALNILIPEAPPGIFTPLSFTATVAPPGTTLGKLLVYRIAYATNALRKYRLLAHNIVQLYLGIYIDAHIPVYKAVAARRSTTLDEAYAAGLQPEDQVPWSQFSIPDHVTTADVVAHIPNDPIARVLAKAIRIVRNVKHGIKQTAKDPGCIDFVTACITSSLLGNYYHARFKTPDDLITIDQRIAVLDNIQSIFDNYVDFALAEYIVALMPIYPYTIRPDATWLDFVQLATMNANKYIRGCPINIPASLSSTILLPPLDADSATAGTCYSECAMPTGHCSTYICPECHGVSAYVVNPPRGFKTIKIPIDPFDDIYMNPDPLVMCDTCSVECAFVDMHGIFLCLNQTTSIAVCPGCNHLVAKHRTHMKSTMCSDCSKTSLATTVCFYDAKPITTDIHQQLSINTQAGAPFVEALPACSFHFTNSIIRDGVVNRVYAKKRRAPARPSRRNQDG